MRIKNKNYPLFFALLAIIGSVIFLESKKTDRRGKADEIIRESEIVKEPKNLGDLENPEEVSADTDRSEIILQKESLFKRAREISTPDGFINIDDLKIADLIGQKIILVDFWTYSCVNCQRTLPFLNQWHKKYADEGLVIVGLHTPEFEFEKDYENVKKATLKYGVKYPVVLDNDYSTWTAYENRYWPRKYLIDIDGFIVYDHIGEGAYEETETKIVELLNERKKVLGESSAVALEIETPDDAPETDFSKIRTPETYLGWGRAEFLANFPSEDCLDKTCTYFLPQEVALNTYVLGGKWRIEKEKAVLDDDIGVIGIAFSASKVNLVVETESSARAEIWLDGKKIRDIEFNEADLYNLLDLGEEYGLHILEIRLEGKGFSAFAFTFG